MGEMQELPPIGTGTVKTFDWKPLLIILAIMGWVLSGFFGVSLKKVTDEKSRLLASSSSTQSESVTVYKWQDIAGKAYPVTEYLSKRDQQNSKIDKQDEKKTTEIWNSSFSIGPAIKSDFQSYGIMADADLRPFGPGTIGGGAVLSKNEQWIWIRYRLLF